MSTTVSCHIQKQLTLSQPNRTTTWRPKAKGRNEVFFSCKSQFEGPNVNIQYQKALEKAAAKKYKDACAALISNPTGQPVLEGYPFRKGDCTLCIDTKKAKDCGIEFWQNEALAIVTDKIIPSTCFIYVEDLKTGAIISTPGEGRRIVPKTVRPQAHHEESESKRARPATTTAGNWLDSHTVQTSSSSAGGNLTATNATASSNGIIPVDLDPEVTTPEASSDSSPSSEPVAAQNLTDANHDDEGVASPVKPIAGGGQLIKGSPSGKAPDNAMPHRVEDSNKVLGETFEPDTLECENCGHYNSSQLVYCHYCAKSLANTDTTSAQKEQLTRQIIESALKDYGCYWRPLKDRGIPSDEASTLKEARNKVKRAKDWGLKNGYPNITTVEERWDHDEWFRDEQTQLGWTREDMVEHTELSHLRVQQQPLPASRSQTKRGRKIQTLQHTR